MPKFSDRQLTPEEKEDIIAYIKSVRDYKQQRRRLRRSAASARCPRASSPSSSAWRRMVGDRDLAGSEGMSTTRSDGGAGGRTPRRRRRAAAPDRDAAPAAGLRRPISRPCRRSSWRGWRRTSTTSRSCTTPNPWPIPGTAAEKRAERAGRAVVPDLGAVRAGVRRRRSCSGRTSTARRATPATWSTPLYTPIVGGTARRWPMLALGVAVIAVRRRSSSRTRSRSSSATTGRRTRSPGARSSPRWSRPARTPASRAAR